MTHTTRIDYVTGSIDRQADVIPSWRAADLLLHGRYTREPAPYGFARHYGAGPRDVYGAHLLRGDEGRDFVLLPGTACEAGRAAHGDDSGLVTVLRELGLTATRLDLALDVHLPHGPRRLWRLWRRNRIVTRTTVARWIDGTDEGQGTTLYLGSAGGKTRLRIYDKHAEALARGDDSVPEGTTRLEIVLRHDKAARTFARLAEGASVDAMTRRLIRDFARPLAGPKDRGGNHDRVETWGPLRAALETPGSDGLAAMPERALSARLATRGAWVAKVAPAVLGWLDLEGCDLDAMARDAAAALRDDPVMTEALRVHGPGGLAAMLAALRKVNPDA